MDMGVMAMQWCSALQNWNLTVSYSLVSYPETSSLGVSLTIGARGVVVIAVGNGHGDTSSNPGRD